MILAYYSSVRMVAVGLETAASIWFEIWGSWIRVKKIHFSRQISDKFRFFPGKFSKNFDFSSKKILITFFSHLLQNFPLSRGQICHLQLNSGQIILFHLESHHFRTYFLYTVRYNNVSRHSKTLPRPFCDSPNNPQPPELTPMSTDADVISVRFVDLILRWLRLLNPCFL